LFQACASQDHDVRATAAEALARHGGPEVKEVLLGALEDKAAGVRYAAATGLLAMRADCSRELGADYRRMLRCHILVSARQWRAVLASGAGALRPLSLALEDEDGVLRREAAWVASQLIRGHEARRAAPSRHGGVGHGPEGRAWNQRTRSSS
jgi:HEAT repeat protein